MTLPDLDTMDKIMIAFVAVSECLALIKRVKSNSVFQLVINIAKALKKTVKQWKRSGS